MGHQMAELQPNQAQATYTKKSRLKHIWTEKSVFTSHVLLGRQFFQVQFWIDTNIIGFWSAEIFL